LAFKKLKTSVKSLRFAPKKPIDVVRHVIIALVFSFICNNLRAQDQTNFTQFYLNPYILNSSFAGIDGKTSLSLIYRKQWINIDGGPVIANFSLHTPINTRLSTGLSVTNDKRGLLSNTSLLLTFGYSIPIHQFSFVRFGISAGGAWNTVDMAKLKDLNDKALGNILGSNASLMGNAGVSYHNKGFTIGVSIPSIFAPSFVSKDAFSITKVSAFQSIILHASNRFYFNNDKHVFEPYVVYRLNSELPSQFEVAGIVHLNHTIYVGSSFKQDFGISALGGIKLKNMVAIGGSYSLKNAGENQLNSPTFEVSINYLLGQHKKGAPIFSFVDTHKEKVKKNTGKSASELLAEKRKQDEEARKKQLAENANKKKVEEGLAKQKQDEAAKRKQDEALAKKKQEDALALHREEVKKREEARKNETIVPKKDTVIATHNPRFRQDMMGSIEVPEGHPEHEQEQLKRLEVHAENPTELHNETGHPNAERHEFVKRGGHAQELEVADYVIGGVFGKEANAKHFADGLVKLGFKADYGHLTEKNLWYVYLTQTDDINVARTERDKYRKMKILRDAWLLTVHH
jgi:type IX secretion system PorP/SprF family membrane protein